MERAYGFITLKSADSERRELAGWASRVEPDRVGDVVESRGMVAPAGTINLLLDHDHVRSVGVVHELTPAAEGVRFKARIAKIAEPGPLQQLCSDAWEMVKSGLRAACSIGFRPLEYEPLAGGGLRFTKWEILELSLVSVPCAPGATIDTIKSFDRQLLQRKALPVVRLGKPVSAPRKALPVVRLADPLRPIGGHEASGSANSGAIAAAVGRALDDHIERQDSAREELKLGADAMLARAIAAGSKATDAELAALRARLAKLENNR
jgi:hypothetical protein